VTAIICQSDDVFMCFTTQIENVPCLRSVWLNDLEHVSHVLGTGTKVGETVCSWLI